MSKVCSILYSRNGFITIQSSSDVSYSYFPLENFSPPSGECGSLSGKFLISHAAMFLKVFFVVAFKNIITGYYCSFYSSLRKMLLCSFFQSEIQSIRIFNCFTENNEHHIDKPPFKQMLLKINRAKLISSAVQLMKSCTIRFKSGFTGNIKNENGL